MQDYESERSGSSDGAAGEGSAGSVWGGATALLDNLRNAQKTHATFDEDVDFISDDEPSNAFVVSLQSCGMKEMCRAALGPSFEQAYDHCRRRYMEQGADMQQVHQELLSLVSLPWPTNRGTVQQLELLVYQELYTH